MSDDAIVHVIDDTKSDRLMIGQMLESAGYRVRVYPGARTFMERFSPSGRGCLVLDFKMPGMDGMELQALIRRKGWTIPIVFCTGEATVEVAVEAMRMGAISLIEKPVVAEKLLACVEEAVVRGDSVMLDESMAAQIEERLPLLTKTERLVLDRVVAGLSSEEIAEEMCRSRKTVELHRSNIKKKLGNNNVGELIRIMTLKKDAG